MEEEFDVEFLKAELEKFETKIKAIQKKYKKMSTMFKDDVKAKEYMTLLSKSFYIQGKLSVLSNGYNHTPDISYIG